MFFALLVTAIFCLALSAFISSMLRSRSVALLAGIDFALTFVVLFLVSAFWWGQETGARDVTMGQAALVSAGFAVVIAGIMLLIRALELKVLNPALRREKARQGLAPTSPRDRDPVPQP